MHHPQLAKFSVMLGLINLALLVVGIPFLGPLFALLFCGPLVIVISIISFLFGIASFKSNPKFAKAGMVLSIITIGAVCFLILIIEKFSPIELF